MVFRPALIGVTGIVGIALAITALLHFARPSPVVLAAVGDTSGYRILDEPGAAADPLAAMRPLLAASDVFVFNYEGVVLDQVPEPGECPTRPDQSTFSTATPIAEHLRLAPVNVATLANNHVLDCGERGIAETVNRFESRGIHTVGAGRSLESACRPVVLESAGRKLAFVAYLAWPDDSMCAAEGAAGAACIRACNGEQRIAALAADGHNVIASVHLHLAAGWTQKAHEAHVEWVRRLLEAGADAVIGHGPHMLQGVLEGDRGIGLTSLGNFLFRTDYRMPPTARRSAVALLAIGSGFPEMTLHPIELDPGGRPRPATGTTGESILRETAWLSEAFDTRLNIVKDGKPVRAELKR